MSVDHPGEPETSDRLVVHRSEVEQLTVYSWMRDGEMISAWPGDGKAVPPDGAEIKLRIVSFPGGCSVREIWLDKETRTHPHGSYEAVLFYQIDGRRVQMVNEESCQVNPGDVCLQPHGVQHSTFQLRAGLFVEFALAAPRHPNPEATWMSASEAQMTRVAEWLDNGKVIRTDAANPEAPPGSSHYEVRLFDLPGYPLREIRMPAGARILPEATAAGQLFYVVRGRMQVTMADIVDEAATGDAMRCPAGGAYAFAAIEDTVFIQTAIPSGAM